MSRRLPRSFFWIDQQMIRNGQWMKLSPGARLAYVALSASCDREGLSIWSRSKLMGLSGCQNPEDWQYQLVELESERLIEPAPDQVPPGIRVLELESETSASGKQSFSGAQSFPTGASPIPAGPIVVHTQTTIHLGGKAREDADSREPS